MEHSTSVHTGRTIIHGKHGLFWSPGPSTRGPVVARRARYTVATTDKRRGPLYSVSGIWYTVVCFELKPAVCVIASERGSKAEYGWASRQSPCVDLLSRECPARTRAPTSSTSMFACLRKCACFRVCVYLCLSVCMSICACVCVYVCVCICVDLLSGSVQPMAPPPTWPKASTPFSRKSTLFWFHRNVKHRPMSIDSFGLFVVRGAPILVHQWVTKKLHIIVSAGGKAIYTKMSFPKNLHAWSNFLFKKLDFETQ